MAMSSQREKPQKKPTLTTLWSQTSDLQNCEQIYFLFFYRPVSLLWYPQQTNTTSFNKTSEFLKIKKKTGIYLLINGTKHIFQDPIKYPELDQVNGCSVHQLTYINWVPMRDRECHFPTQDIMSQNLGFKKISRVVDFHSKV